MDQQPACVKSCLTGALSIGPKDRMIKKAYARVKELGGDANVYGDKFVGAPTSCTFFEKPPFYDELQTRRCRLPIISLKDLLIRSVFWPGGTAGPGPSSICIIHGPKIAL